MTTEDLFLNLIDKVEVRVNPLIKTFVSNYSGVKIYAECKIASHRVIWDRTVILVEANEDGAVCKDLNECSLTVKIEVTSKLCELAVAVENELNRLHSIVDTL